MIHEDERRLLVEWGIGENWKVCKTIFIKEDTTLGNHFHKVKTECFMLVSGSGFFNDSPMKIGKEYIVLPGNEHHFVLIKGSVLIGLCTHEYDKSDDYEALWLKLEAYFEGKTDRFEIETRLKHDCITIVTRLKHDCNTIVTRL